MGTQANFKDKYVMVSSDPITVSENIMVESIDTTNDAGDYWSLCFDGNSATDATAPNGGAAPQADDIRLDIMGHGATATATWYKGTGTGWAVMAAPASSIASWAETLSTSPTSTTAHYILELTLIKQTLGLPPQFALRVAIYDAHSGGAALQAWPPGSVSIPDEWGAIPYTGDAYTGPVPESLNLFAFLLLSSIAVIAGAVLIRKQSKIPKLTHSPASVP
ncbi:MAG: hypothetical protein NWE93_13325 [Candidatus Bathyarchaeota archaeon]|nr:hypothetical protein [Candidatus Bathyarchaeota archaeon]